MNEEFIPKDSNCVELKKSNKILLVVVLPEITENIGVNFQNHKVILEIWHL